MSRSFLIIFALKALGIAIVFIAALLPSVVYYFLTRAKRNPMGWALACNLIGSFIATQASRYYGVLGGLRGYRFQLWLFSNIACQVVMIVLMHRPGKPKKIAEVTLPVPLPPGKE